MTVEIDFDIRQTEIRIVNRLDVVQQVLDERVAADSNYFCPDDTGDLKGSVYPIQGNGELEWNVPYAKEQYYLKPNKSKDKNPNASLLWFEKAKSANLKNWRDLANARYS